MKSSLFFSFFLLCSFICSANTYVVTSNANGGAGTLRTAITSANNSIGRDTIIFNLGSTVASRTISLTTNLPVINDTLVIDGTSQPSPAFGNSDAKIIINAVVGNLLGLRLYADYCEVYGIYIKGFGNAILFNVSQLNFGTRIGAPGKGNVLSGSPGTGIAGFDLNGTIIHSNFIGVDTTGLQVESNQGYGISVGSFLENGLIENNTIGGNLLGGVFIASGDSLQMIDNKIGVSYLGVSIAGNGDLGVFVGYVGSNKGCLIEGNVISANANGGIRISSDFSIVRNNFIGTDISGTQNFGNNNGFGIMIDGKSIEITNNVISGNIGNGIEINLFARNVNVKANKIGCDISGLNSLGNGNYGIKINGDSCMIGGYSITDRNIITSNTRGIYLTSNAVDILNNYIGIGIDGISSLGNSEYGIYIANAQNFNIGSSSGNGNVISQNGLNGIQFQSGNGIISENIIGLSADSIPFSVGQNRGIEIWNGASGKIENNLIEGHSTDAIYLQSASNIEILGNSIKNNIEQGIQLTGTCLNVTIGTDSSPNIIQDNGMEGIQLSANCNGISMFANLFICNGQTNGANGISGDTGFNNGILPGIINFTNGLISGNTIPSARVDLFSGSEICTSCEGSNKLQTFYSDNTGNWQTNISVSTPALMVMVTDTLTNSSSTFSSCIQNTVSTDQINNEFEVMPNPFYEGFMLKSTESYYKLFDIYGRILSEEKITSPEFWINTQMLPKGIYFLEVGQFVSQKKRLVKIN
jgi:hypothetical protein